jgi:hypothetical protein
MVTITKKKEKNSLIQRRIFSVKNLAEKGNDIFFLKKGLIPVALKEQNVVCFLVVLRESEKPQRL